MNVANVTHEDIIRQQESAKTIDEISCSDDAAVWLECNWGEILEGDPYAYVDQNLLQTHLSLIELQHRKLSYKSSKPDVDLRNTFEEIFVKLFAFSDSSYLRGVNSSLKEKALQKLQEKKKEVS